MIMPKEKSRRQVGFLLSDKVSPLTEAQKAKLKRELHSGAVKVKKGGRKRHGFQMPKKNKFGYY